LHAGSLLLRQGPGGRELSAEAQDLLGQRVRVVHERRVAEVRRREHAGVRGQVLLEEREL